jgi:hypothetical protein
MRIGSPRRASVAGLELTQPESPILLALILANLLLSGWVLRNRRRSGAMS